jgi:hypothetical protein
MKARRIKSKNTFYNGYNFRSRLEARWAVWFDCMEIKYRYESEGFDLDGKAYLPDFWLPDLNIWIEIKPSPPNHKEVEKAVMLEEKTGDRVMFFVGDCWPSECYRVYFTRENGVFKELFDDYWNDSAQTFKEARAFRRARSARFEFGETPSCQTSFEFGDAS